MVRWPFVLGFCTTGTNAGPVPHRFLAVFGAKDDRMGQSNSVSVTVLSIGHFWAVKGWQNAKKCQKMGDRTVNRAEVTCFGLGMTFFGSGGNFSHD